MSGRVQTTHRQSAIVRSGQPCRVSYNWRVIRRMTPGAPFQGASGNDRLTMSARHPHSIGYEAVILQRRALRMAKGGDAKHHSAEELLADWRAAERDSVAAHDAASVAARAVTAAATAEDAAMEAETAAREATEAAARAKDAAERAKAAASKAAETAQKAADTTEDDQARADKTVLDADQAEAAARDRFHAAQESGFPKD